MSDVRVIRHKNPDQRTQVMTDTESKTVTPYRAEKQARVDSVGHLARVWEEYKQDRTAIRAEAMRTAAQHLQLERKVLKRQIQSALKRPGITVADVVVAMGTTRKTVEQILKTED